MKTIKTTDTVMYHDAEGHGVADGTIADWFSRPIKLGQHLNDEECEMLAAFRGYAINTEEEDKNCYDTAYYVDDATGWTVHVYQGDPLKNTRASAPNTNA